jgi:putative transposase
MNPVKAGLAAHPRDYRWSSYRANAEGQTSSLIEPHPAFPGASAYRGLFDGLFDEALVEDLRKATRGGYAVGAIRLRKRRGIGRK